MNTATALSGETPKSGDVIDVSFIKQRLMDLPIERAWKSFEALNTLLLGNPAWLKHVGDINEALIERERQKELSQKRIETILEKSASEPRIQNLVHAHAGSTAHIGCPVENAEIKMIDKGENE